MVMHAWVGAHVRGWMRRSGIVGCTWCQVIHSSLVLYHSFHSSIMRCRSATIATSV